MRGVVFVYKGSTPGIEKLFLLSFQGDVSSTFRAENTHQNLCFKAKKSYNFLNDSKKTLKKSRKRLFDPQIGQNMGVNFVKSVDFWIDFRTSSSKFSLLPPFFFWKMFLLIA